MAKSPSPLLLWARQEMLLAVPPHWTRISAAAFAALSLGVATSGYVLSLSRSVSDERQSVFVSET